MAEVTLDPRLISETVNRLRERIEARFPGSGLAGVAGQLCRIAEKANATSDWIARPIWPLRILVLTLIGIILLGLVLTLSTLPWPQGGLELAQFIQVLESAINDVVLIVAAIFFLGGIETRIKRERALRSIHELRAIAHVIDMHQLTKDPEFVISDLQPTSHSPDRIDDRVLLGRYLEYCSEMLALTSKLAASYAFDNSDAVVLGAIREIQELVGLLSGKIWQKRVILDTAS